MTRTGSKLISDEEVFGSEEVDESSEASLKTQSPLSFLAPMMFKKDANGDGSLTLEELKAGMKGKALENAEKRFEKLDKDGDGKVSLEEFKAGMGQQKKKK